MDKYIIESEKKRAFENMPVPAVIFQFVNNRVEALAISDGFCDLFGIERDMAMQLKDFELYRNNHKDDRARMANAAYRFAIDDEPYDIVYRQKNYTTGGYFIVHAIGRHVFTEDGTRLSYVWYMYEGAYGEEHGFDKETKLTMANDDAFRLELNKVMSEWVNKVSAIQENYCDRLTGVPNNSYFTLLAEERIFSDVRNGKNPAILFFDLMGMKAFNEKNGFAEGDDLLVAFSDVLKKYFGTEGCGRAGSNHFLAYVEDDSELEEMIDTLLLEISQMNDGNSLPVSIGICKGEYLENGAKNACDRAKIACDFEKKSYASHYTYFDKSMHDSWLIKSYILNNVDKAIREGWIKAYYQPLVRSVTGLVSSEEALARWDDPEKGMLSPAEFIPVLEDAGLLYKVDLHMVDMILADIKRKNDDGMGCVPVSVNLSWSDFQACDMVREITEKADAAGVAHNMINIEITESVIGKDPDYMKLQIDRFHENGFSVWMDDFGSGYSSLDILKDYDFDMIKFDMQFMKTNGSSEKNRIIMEEMTHLAMRMGIDTVAEGVETYEQVVFLREIGCDRIQGYYYSKPNDVEEIMRRYREKTGIGLEDTKEAEYYDVISRTNLSEHDIGDKVKESPFSFINNIPIAIIETDDREYYAVRYNKPYSEFIDNELRSIRESDRKDSKLRIIPDTHFPEVVAKCRKTGNWEYFERDTEKGFYIKAFVKKLIDNPVTGATAFMVVIMSVVSN